MPQPMRSSSLCVASASMLSKRVPGRSPFFSPTGSVQNRCVFWVGPSLTPINAKQLFLNRFGIDAFQKGSRSPFFPRWVLFKTDVCFLGCIPGPNQCEAAPFASLRPRCFPKGFRAGAFFFPQWDLFKNRCVFSGTIPDPNQSETAPFESLWHRCFPKGFRAGALFSPTGFVQNRCVFFSGPARIPTNPKQLLLTRSGIDAFQKCSGPELLFSPMGSVQNRWVLFGDQPGSQPIRNSPL